MSDWECRHAMRCGSQAVCELLVQVKELERDLGEARRLATQATDLLAPLIDLNDPEMLGKFVVLDANCESWQEDPR